MQRHRWGPRAGAAAAAVLLAACGGRAAPEPGRDDLAGDATVRAGVPDLAVEPDRVTTTIGATSGLRADQHRITGVVRSLVGDDVVTSPIATPFTLRAPMPGGRRAVFTDAFVAGSRSTITWDGGRPLPVEGSGALDLGPAHVELGPGGLSWVIDGGGRSLLPGSYRLGAPVAVGDTGLARPRDAVELQATAETVLMTDGGVTITTGVVPTHLEGPGRVTIEGDLRIDTAAGSRKATRATFGPGPLTIDLVPSGTEWRVVALLQGELQSER